MADEEHLLLALEDTSRTGVRVAGLRVLAAIVGFAATIVIARALGPVGRGLYALPLAFLGIAMALSHVGLESANMFLASHGLTLRRLWATSTVASLLVSGAAWATVAGASILVGPTFVGGLPASWVGIALAQLPILLMTLYWTSVLQLDGALAPTAVVTVVGTVANAAMVFAVGLAGALTPFRVLTLTWVTAGVTWILVLRLGMHRGIASLATDRTLLARAIAFGLRAQLATAFAFLLLRMDQVLVQGILGFRELGLYALTVVLAELLWLITDPFAASLLPHQVRAGNGDERRLGYATARLGLALSAILCLFVWIVAPHGIRFIYGEPFVDATWPVRWLLPGVAAIAAQRPLYAIVTKEGRMGLAAAMNAAALAVNLALNLLLLPAVGVVGAAIASTVTYLILGVGYVLATRRPGVVGWGDLVPRRDDLLLLSRALRRGARGG